MIKAIFFDIDGTLVSFETHAILANTLQTLHALKEKGILLFIATGRGRDGLNCLEKFPFDGYITLNGQFCYDHTGKVLYENTIVQEDLTTLLQTLKKKNFPCGFTMRDGKIYNYRDERVEALHDMTKNDDQPLGDISGMDTKSVYQIQAFLNDNEEKELMQKMKHCTSSRWYPTFCDISPLGGTKVLGMDVFAKQYGFTMKETMAFGDGGNDLEMLSHACYGIAMANGTDVLKDAADYVTDSVDDDGITKAIRYYSVLE